jgi:hypothetical protein
VISYGYNFFILLCDDFLKGSPNYCAYRKILVRIVSSTRIVCTKNNLDKILYVFSVNRNGGQLGHPPTSHIRMANGEPAPLERGLFLACFVAFVFLFI